MQARDTVIELNELPERHLLVGWLVGCFEDLRRFSNILAIS